MGITLIEMWSIGTVEMFLESAERLLQFGLGHDVVCSFSPPATATENEQKTDSTSASETPFERASRVTFR